MMEDSHVPCEALLVMPDVDEMLVTLRLSAMSAYHSTGRFVIHRSITPYLRHPYDHAIMLRALIKMHVRRIKTLNHPA
jgi:hypothetical protein